MEITRISTLLSRFVVQVKGLNSISQYDINKISENVLVPILDIIYGVNLINANTIKKHYPGLDLVDERAKVAFQVTATPSIEKIKHTLEQCLKEKHNEAFDCIYVYIITERSKKYNDNLIKKITKGKLEFKSSKHIVDYSSVLGLLEGLSIDKICKVRKILESQFADIENMISHIKTRSDYDQYILNKYQYIEMRGYSPRISGKEIKMELESLFVPVQISVDYNSERVAGQGVEHEGAKEKLSPYKALSKKENIVILANPGAGKSTLFKYLAYNICQRAQEDSAFNHIIPLLVRVADYAEYYESHKSSLYDFIAGHCDKQYGSLFTECLEENKLLLLLDGLDEVNNRNIRHTIVEQINDLLSRYPNNRYAVSSRIVGYKETSLGGKFIHYKLNDFTIDEIEKFSKKWYRAIAKHSDQNYENADQEANDLISSISKSASVLRLASNPLLMTIIAMIHHRGMQLPNKRVELYDRAAETFLENWVMLRKGSLKREVDKDDIIEIMSPIAFHIHKTYSNGLIEENEFKSLFQDNYLKIHSQTSKVEAKVACKKFIDYLREDAGFFYEKGQDEDGNSMFGFVHLTFQEYFASIEMVNQWEEGGLKLENYVFNPRWIEIIRLSSALFRVQYKGRGGREKATQFIESILAAEDNFPYLQRPLYVACTALADDVEINLEKFKDIFDKVINKVLLNDSLGIWRFEIIIESLLDIKAYQDIVLERLLSEVRSDNDTVSESIVSVLLNATDNSFLHNKVIELVKSKDNTTFKEFFWKSITGLPDLEDGHQNEWRELILSYINEDEFDPSIDENIDLIRTYIYSFFDYSEGGEMSDQEKVSLYVTAIETFKKPQDILPSILFHLHMYTEGSYANLYRKFYDELSERYQTIDLIALQAKIDFYELKEKEIGFVEASLMFDTGNNYIRVYEQSKKFVVSVDVDFKLTSFAFCFEANTYAEAAQLVQDKLLTRCLEKIDVFVGVFKLYYNDEKKDKLNKDELDLIRTNIDNIAWSYSENRRVIINYINTLLDSIQGITIDDRTFMSAIKVFRYRFIETVSEFNYKYATESYIQTVKDSYLSDHIKLYILHSISKKYDCKEYLENSILRFEKLSQDNATEKELRQDIFYVLDSVLRL